MSRFKQRSNKPKKGSNAPADRMNSTVIKINSSNNQSNDANVKQTKPNKLLKSSTKLTEILGLCGVISAMAPIFSNDVYYTVDYFCATGIIELVKKITIWLKCQWNETFHYLIQNSCQIDEEWHLFCCVNSNLGSWFIQDLDIC